MGGSPVMLDPVVIPLVQGPKILDVGCGFGKWGYLCTSNYWQTHASVRGSHPEIVGCDGYDANVQMCRDNGCYREVLHLTVPPLPFEDCSFDSVLLIEIIEHLKEDSARRAHRRGQTGSPPQGHPFNPQLPGLPGRNQQHNRLECSGCSPVLFQPRTSAQVGIQDIRLWPDAGA